MGKIIAVFLILIYSSFYAFAQKIESDSTLNERIQKYLQNTFSDTSFLQELTVFIIIRNGSCYTLCNEKLYDFLHKIMNNDCNKLILLTHKEDLVLNNNISSYNNTKFIYPDRLELGISGLDGVDHMLVYLSKGTVMNVYKVSLSNYKKIIKSHKKWQRNLNNCQL